MYVARVWNGSEKCCTKYTVATYSVHLTNTDSRLLQPHIMWLKLNIYIFSHGVIVGAKWDISRISKMATIV